MRSKRTSALKARTTVSQLKSSIDEHEFSKSGNKIEDSETFSEKSDSSSDVDEVVSCELVSSASSLPEEELEEDEDEIIVKPSPAKRGRKKKETTKYPSGVNYVKLSEYRIYGIGPFPLSTWTKAIIEARPIKRGLKTKKDNPRAQRPPTEMLKLKESPVVTEIPLSMKNLKVSDEIITVRECTPINLKVKLNNLESTDIQMKKTVKTEGLLVFYAGKGAVTGLSWCRCCRCLLATSNYPSLDFKDKLNTFNSCKSEIEIWRFKAKEFEIENLCTIKHHFGVARKLEWYPFASPESRILAGAFSDKTVRIFNVPSNNLKAVNLENQFCLTFSNSSAFCWSKNHNKFVTGTFDGYLVFWSLSEEVPMKLFSTKISNQPIFSISQNPNNHNQFIIGALDQSIFLFDQTEPFQTRPYFSLLNLIPNVLWIDDGVIFWDTDQNIRLIPNSSDVSTRQALFAEFDCAVSDIALSDLHNVIAVSGADGSVHYVIMMKKDQTSFTYERRFFKMEIEQNDPKLVKVSALKSEPTHLTAHRIHDLENGATRLAWSTTPDGPGLLAIGSGTGLVVLLALDQFLLAY